MIDEIVRDAGERMSKSIDSLRQSLGKVRTGRAHPSLLDHLTVVYYGAETPLSQVANIGVEDARTLTITPWEKQMVQAIEKAILTSDLGLTPANDGKVVRIPIPPLTEERRKELVKRVHRLAEDHKVGVREGRRDALAMLKSLESEGTVPADDRRREEKRIQGLTDDFIKKIDETTQQKEEEVLQV